MKVSLRKANAIQLTINEEINSTPLETTVSIGRFDTPQVVMTGAVSKLNDAYIKRIDLTKAIYAIRKLIASANQISGISDLLTDMAHIQATVKFSKPLSAVTQYAPDAAVLAAQHHDLTEEKAPERGYGSRRDSISVALVEQKFAEQMKDQLIGLRKTQQTISDKILELNIKTEIELNEDTAMLLKQYSIV